MSHKPVLLKEVLECLAPQSGGIYVDGTFGAGGYTRAILEAADCKVYAIDRDPDAIARAQKMAEDFPGRLFAVQGPFGSMHEMLGRLGLEKLDGIVLDLGVSSMQIDQAERGFSFQKDGPLDMRMSQQGPSAADAVNMLPETEIARILFEFGQEKQSRRIAKKILEERRREPIATTAQLAKIIHSAKGRPKENGGIDSATRSFQALRIYTNDELGELDRALIAAEHLLEAGGRLVVVTFHSLEDVRVKSFLKTRSGEESRPSRHLPVCDRLQKPAPSFTLLTRKALSAGADETTVNPRARSARLRAGIRTQNAAWPQEIAA